MADKHDPVRLVQTSLQEIDSVVRRAAKEVELCWFKNRKSNVCTLKSASEFQNEVPCNGAVVKIDEMKRSFILFSTKMPLKVLFNPVYIIEPKDLCRKEQKKNYEPCLSCFSGLHLDVAWSTFVNCCTKSFPNLTISKKRCRKHDEHDPSSAHLMHKSARTSIQVTRQGNFAQLPLFLGFVLGHVLPNNKLDHTSEKSYISNQDIVTRLTKLCNPPDMDQFHAISGFLQGRLADANDFFSNLKFAKIGGVPSNFSGVTSSEKEGDENSSLEPREDNGNSPVHTPKLPNSLLNIPLSQVERLKSTLSTVSLTELVELIPHLGRSINQYPDKKRLISVQDFFKYAESEGRRFFEELDRDGDGQVTLEDLEVAVAKRRLPRRYAKNFLRRTRSHLFSSSIGWKQFLSLMEQREPTILRAYTALCLSKSGTLQKNQLLISLKHAGFPANDENVVAMMRCLDADSDEAISYGHFRNFMLLLPSEHLAGDPRSIWFEAATLVAVPPPVDIPTENVLKSAFAGGLACALSTSVMHPIDTIKTRVQASSLSFREVIAELPEVGIKGLYRGSIPAIIGQFSSHGLRTGIFEASKLVLMKIAPTLPEIQVQSLASFCSTFLGTAVRIPCEVLKQRLQAGVFDNELEAVVETFQQDGIKGFFCGTGATLCREVPFYVAGMGLYGEAKKAAQHFLNRNLEPWESLMVGALSGGLAAVMTTPFDVMKTRMMISPHGMPISMPDVALSILAQEGPAGLFKGAVPRFFWIAPLGAMNFAGYELARKAMNKDDHLMCKSEKPAPRGT